MQQFIVPGHGLVAEGAAFGVDGNRVRWNSTGGVGYAKCSCGVMSDTELPNGSSRKRWHVEHKQAVLAATPRI